MGRAGSRASTMRSSPASKATTSASSDADDELGVADRDPVGGAHPGQGAVGHGQAGGGQGVGGEVLGDHRLGHEGVAHGLDDGDRRPHAEPQATGGLADEQPTQADIAQPVAAPGVERIVAGSQQEGRVRKALLARHLLGEAHEGGRLVVEHEGGGHEVKSILFSHEKRAPPRAAPPARRRPPRCRRRAAARRPRDDVRGVAGERRRRRPRGPPWGAGGRARRERRGVAGRRARRVAGGLRGRRRRQPRAAGRGAAAARGGRRRRPRRPWRRRGRRAHGQRCRAGGRRGGRHHVHVGDDRPSQGGAHPGRLRCGRASAAWPGAAACPTTAGRRGSRCAPPALCSCTSPTWAGCWGPSPGSTSVSRSCCARSGRATSPSTCSGGTG